MLTADFRPALVQKTRALGNAIFYILLWAATPRFGAGHRHPIAHCMRMNAWNAMVKIRNESE